MVDVDNLTDAELRTKLLEFGFPVMPITGTTRKVMKKKLKMLQDNKNKLGSEGGRRSMGRYSSEEESDSDIRATKKKENRRATMAAPLMQPPASTTRGRKSSRLNETPEPELSNSPSKRDTRTTTSTTTTRTQKIIRSNQDDFDTGSDSESDVVANNYSSSRGADLSYKRSSPVKSSLSASYVSPAAYSPAKSVDTSYGSTRNVSFNANVSPARLGAGYSSPGSNASEYASDRLNQIRSRLSLNSSAYDKPLYSPPAPVEKEETPFLSNFTRRLSALSNANQKTDYDYKNDVIKEHDTNGASGFVRSQLSSYRAARGRDTTYDYKANQNSILKNNFVSFAVLAGAALFFVFLAIMYLGMRSDTSVVPAGSVIPHCIRNDPATKKGVNCIPEHEVTTAIHLLNVLKPELQKKAVANKCFDATIKAHMTESEIVNFCKTNFGVKDEIQIKNDLRNLQILSFNNPEWGLSIVQTENNNGVVSKADISVNMEQVIFNYDHKVTSLVMFQADLPLRCTFYNTFQILAKSALFVGLVFGLLYASNHGYKLYKNQELRRKEDIGFMVEKIIDILQSSASEEAGDNFVVINHVRDMILPVQDRKHKEKTWTQAVNFINENESRVRTEVQVVQGEPFEVWRWIGSANLSMSGDHSDYIYRYGRRIVDAQYLIAETLKFPHRRLRFCTNNDVEIKNEVREGFLSILLLTCRKCKAEHPVCSEDPKSDLMNVNLALVAGIVSLGLNLYHLNEICSALHVPAVSCDDYNQYLDEIFEIYNQSMTDSEKSKKQSFDEEITRTSTPIKAETSEDYEVRKEKFLESLEKTPEEISEMSQMTMNQRDNSLWYKERKKRLTASNFGRICKLLKTTDRRKVTQDILHSTFTGNVYTKYGNDNESNAVRDFEQMIGQRVTACGLFIHPDYPFLAASPDGLLGSDAIVEVKCPYKAKDLTPEEAIRQKQVQYATMDNGHFSLKRSDKYYYQVQGQLFVTGRECCYFIVWTPFGLVYEKIRKDPLFWDEMLPKLAEFYFQHLLPEIIEMVND